MLRRKQVPARDNLAPAVPQSGCATCPNRCLTGAEKLVGVGFRYWLAGYQTGDIDCWEQAWNVFANDLGSTKAKAAITELSCWVRTIKSSSRRTIEVYPGPCRLFCQDECLAVSMVAASQHNLCPALRANAFCLIENSDIHSVVEGAQTFGDLLRELDVVLSPGSVFGAANANATSARHDH